MTATETQHPALLWKWGKRESLPVQQARFNSKEVGFREEKSLARFASWASVQRSYYPGKSKQQTTGLWSPTGGEQHRFYPTLDRLFLPPSTPCPSPDRVLKRWRVAWDDLDLKTDWDNRTKYSQWMSIARKLTFTFTLTPHSQSLPKDGGWYFFNLLLPSVTNTSKIQPSFLLITVFELTSHKTQ